MNAHPTPTQLLLHHDAWGRLVLTDDHGQEHAGVEPVRCFPMSDPHRYVALVDEEGREVYWLDDLDSLPADARQLLEAHLAQREFMPVLHRILKVSAPVEPAEWEVETDRGPTRFILNSEDDVRRLDDQRVMIVDARGIRYLIPNAEALDGASRRNIERYL